MGPPGWGRAGRAKGGGAIKVGLGKGANLAVEHAGAQLQGWTPAPYATKAEVDASFARHWSVCSVRNSSITPRLR